MSSGWPGKVDSLNWLDRDIVTSFKVPERSSGDRFLFKMKKGGRFSFLSKGVTIDSLKGLTVFRVVWTTFMVAATSVPYVVNFLSTPPGSHYTWIIPPYPEDSFGYAAWAQQAVHGAWLFKIKFTAIPHHAFLFHPFFLICGWLSALFSCEVGLVFFTVKAAGVILFMAIFYRYSDYLGFNSTASVTASVLVGVSSGIGGLLALCGWTDGMSIPPADLWMPEMSTYWSLLWNPLFPFSLSLLLLSIYWLDRGSRDGIARDFWRSGLSTGVMALLHPYSIPLLLAWGGIVTAIRQRERSIGFLARYLAASLPVLIYLLWVSQTNQLVSQHNAQGLMKSPPVVAYVFGFGLLLFFVAVGLIVRGKLLIGRHWQVFIWFFLSVILAFSPFWFQRKLVFGAHIALCILAAGCFDLILQAISPAWLRRVVLIALAVIFLPFLVTTPVYLVRTQRDKVKQNQDGAYYVSAELMEGLHILRDRTKPAEVVMAQYSTSRLIPAFAGNTVVWGHWAQSVDLKQRKKWMQHLFSFDSDWSGTERSTEFWGDNVQFLFADGPLKDSLERHPYAWEVILKGAPIIFENPSVIIYARPAGL